MYAEDILWYNDSVSEVCASDMPVVWCAVCLCRRKETMYIHLGLGVVVREEDVIGIFDMDNTTVSKTMRDFLRYAEENNMVEDVCYDLPRSIVVCRDFVNGQRVYITQIAPATLLKRSRAELRGVPFRKAPQKG